MSSFDHLAHQRLRLRWLRGVEASLRGDVVAQRAWLDVTLLHLHEQRARLFPLRRVRPPERRQGGVVAVPEAFCFFVFFRTPKNSAMRVNECLILSVFSVLAKFSELSTTTRNIIQMRCRWNG